MQTKKKRALFPFFHYACAFFMGFVALKLAPSQSSFPQRAVVFVLQPPCDSPLLWWQKESSKEKRIEASLSPKDLPKDLPWIVYTTKGKRTWHTLTCDHFRCRGHGGRAPLKIREQEYLFDCWGSDHGLPWKEGREFIEPLLPLLLNELQEELQTAIVIISGHRCPTHHRFITKGHGSMTDRHLFGAAADFSLPDFDTKPERLVEALETIFCRFSPQQEEAVFQAENEKNVWKNSFCEIRWHPIDSFDSPDHPKESGFFELTLRRRLDKTKILGSPQEAYRLPLF